LISFGIGIDVGLVGDILNVGIGNLLKDVECGPDGPDKEQPLSGALAVDLVHAEHVADACIDSGGLMVWIKVHLLGVGGIAVGLRLRA
jgi:hypothetical protein